MIRSPALSQRTTSRGLVTSGVEYSGWAWSTYSRAPLVRMTLARPASSSASRYSGPSALPRSKPRASRSGDSSSKSHRARRARGTSARPPYPFTICDDSSIAFAPGWPGTETPYSTSVPITRRTVMRPPYGRAGRRRVHSAYRTGRYLGHCPFRRAAGGLTERHGGEDPVDGPGAAGGGAALPEGDPGGGQPPQPRGEAQARVGAGDLPAAVRGRLVPERPEPLVHHRARGHRADAAALAAGRRAGAPPPAVRLPRRRGGHRAAGVQGPADVEDLQAAPGVALQGQAEQSAVGLGDRAGRHRHGERPEPDRPAGAGRDGRARPGGRRAGPGSEVRGRLARAGRGARAAGEHQPGQQSHRPGTGAGRPGRVARAGRSPRRGGGGAATGGAAHGLPLRRRPRPYVPAGRGSRRQAHPSANRHARGRRPAGRDRRPRRRAVLQVLPGVGDRVDRPPGLGALAGDQGADVDDPLALLAGDAGPVVRVGGVGQVFVLPELVDAGVEQVLQPDAFLVELQEVLDRHLLRPVNDALHHRAEVEVLEYRTSLSP